MEKKPVASEEAPSAKGESSENVNYVDNARRVFVGAVLSMSWQLAIVVLVPIVGGFKLDQHLHTEPLLTIVGFFLAMGGMAVVLWRQLQELTPPAGKNKKGPRLS